MCLVNVNYRSYLRAARRWVMLLTSWPSCVCVCARVCVCVGVNAALIRPAGVDNAGGHTQRRCGEGGRWVSDDLQASTRSDVLTEAPSWPIMRITFPLTRPLCALGWKTKKRSCEIRGMTKRRMRYYCCLNNKLRLSCGTEMWLNLSSEWF